MISIRIAKALMKGSGLVPNPWENEHADTASRRVWFQNRARKERTGTRFRGSEVLGKLWLAPKASVGV